MIGSFLMPGHNNYNNVKPRLSREDRKERTLKKNRDVRIERAYYQNCSGVQIDILDISKVFDHGHEVILANPAITEPELGKAVKDFVATIAK